MVNPEEVMVAASQLRFTPTSRKGQYTGDLAHEWVMSRSFGIDNWLMVRQAIQDHGEDRPFFKTTFRYLDHDGFSYWVMPAWTKSNWGTKFDPTDNYVLNRQKIKEDA